MKRARGFTLRLGRGEGAALRRFLKRQTSKLIRRLGKAMGEDAPKRVTQGYAD